MIIISFLLYLTSSKAQTFMSKCEQCIIRKINPLNSLTKDELVRISKCKVTKTLKKGDILFDEGEHINGIYCISKGICKISKMSNNGRDQIVSLIKSGDIVGERSLINDEASNLKAIAINDMSVCFIPKEEIIRDLENNPKFTMAILKNMASSLKTADNIIVDMAQKTVKQRLAATLVFLNDKFEKDEDGAIDISLSREDIANIIGTATESAIRLLSEFKKEKLITFKGKSIHILNVSELRKIAEGF